MFGYPFILASDRGHIMKSLVTYFMKPKNVPLLAVIVTVLIAVISGIAYLLQPAPKEAVPITIQNATATKGGAAIISTGKGSVTIVKDAVDE
jgi:hypothetical protein